MKKRVRIRIVYLFLGRFFFQYVTFPILNNNYVCTPLHITNFALDGDFV